MSLHQRLGPGHEDATELGVARKHRRERARVAVARGIEERVQHAQDLVVFGRTERSRIRECVHRTQQRRNDDPEAKRKDA